MRRIPCLLRARDSVSCYDTTSSALASPPRRPPSLQRAVPHKIYDDMQRPTASQPVSCSSLSSAILETFFRSKMSTFLLRSPTLKLPNYHNYQGKGDLIKMLKNSNVTLKCIRDRWHIDIVDSIKIADDSWSVFYYFD